MAEYIERKSAFKALEIFGDKRTLDEVYERIEKIPAADVVEVVRCERCKWQRKWLLDSGYYWYECTNGNEALGLDGEFCSDGAEMEGADGNDTIRI